jgi:class 3 adenylate cyclase
LIQYLMQRVYDGDSEQWRAALDDAEGRFLREQSTIFSSWWQSFEEDAQAIYGQLTASDARPEGELIAQHPGHGKRALDVLAHTGVVRWDREARTVEAAGTLFRRWVEESGLLVRALSPSEPPPPAEPPGQGAWSTGIGRRIATVLFTDIVSSTQLTAELGDRRWLELMDAHNSRVREALAAFRGREVKTMGDGFLALFETPAAAIRCACAIASSVRPLGLEVRAGLHAGEYEAVGDDVIGIAISYAAWVMSRARGGEVVVSETVRGLVAGSGIRFVDRGAHRVKGSNERHRLYAVDRAGHPRQPALP